MKVWDSDGELSLLDLLKADADVTARLSADQLIALFDLGYHMKQVDTIFIRVLGDCRRTPSPPGAGRSLRLETREKLANYRESGRSRRNEVGYVRPIIWVLVANRKRGGW